MIVCPCCNGTGEIVEKCPVYLTPLQYRIWDLVRRSADGIGGRDLVDVIYAGNSNGEPPYAMTSVHVTIRNANVRLAAANQKIISNGGRTSTYRLKHLNDGQ